jgi:hypothetical protein
MRIFLGFDDTDVIGAPIGTGRLVRMFGEHLPAGMRLWGVLRQQLLLDPAIPYTSHNSSACAVVDIEDPSQEEILVERAIAHIGQYASEGSDPGLCVVRGDGDATALIDFALSCTFRVQTQGEACRAASESGARLMGLGGTNDGVIGAVAAVGLTLYGWAGRFLEFNDLRGLPKPPTIRDIEAKGIRVMPLENEPCVLPAETVVETKGWISPRLWGGAATLPLRWQDGAWRAIGKRPRDAEVAE